MEGSRERLLVVMRHAQAESFAPDDRQRRLTTEGRSAATDAGRWLASRGIEIDAALVSSALRTRQTWELVAEGGGWTGVVPTFDEALYSAGTDSVLATLRTLPDASRTALFVGHNPTAGMLVQLLTGGVGDSELVGRLSSGFPPASSAVLAVPGAWADLDLGEARLVDVRVVHR